MNSNTHTHNTLSTTVIVENQQPSSTSQKRGRGRPRKERPAPMLPDYVSKLDSMSPSEITAQICNGTILPKYINDWSRFSDIDKARIIVKYPKFFYEFRNPFISSFSPIALTYLISKMPTLTKHIHTLGKLSVEEWEYILTKQPHLIEDCACKEKLNSETWMLILLNYDLAHCLFNRWNELTKSQWLKLLKKKPKYISEFCNIESIIQLLTPKNLATAHAI